MPINKKQIKRMALFISEVKQHNYPNSRTFAKRLKSLDLDDNVNVVCTPRTIQRDIRALIEEFDAPLVYDNERYGYVLSNPYWEFAVPLLSQYEILAMVLGVRLAENIFPASRVRTQMIEVLAQQLTRNENALLEVAYLDSLLVCNHMTTHPDGEVFQKVFDAWSRNEGIDIEYENARDEKSLRRVDPHILAFQDGGWFIKGYCHLRETILTFAVHRIVSVKLTGKVFEHDKKIVEDTAKEGLFAFNRVENVVLICENRIINHAIDYQFHQDQEIISLENDKFELRIPSAQYDELVRWIMWQIGRVAVKEPETLRENIIKYADDIKVANGTTTL